MPAQLSYKTLREENSAEFIINKSRFIGYGCPCETEEEALAFLARIRQKHKDATHNCYAYIIGLNSGIMRYSDDGEPGGTAGMPIIEVMKARGVVNCAVVVTRYFGGILLGAGGLVRAYSKSAADAVTKAGMVSYLPGTILDIPMDYSRYGTLEGFIRANAEVRNVAFSQNVVVTVAVEDTNLLKFMKEVTERSDGRCTPVTIGTGYMKKEEI